VPDRAPGSADRAVGIWLLICAGLVAAMVAVGGLTRLTRSGLSIVEWKPLLGALPPLTESAWAEELTKYRTSPEAQQVNVGLSLAGFQQIYYVEWFHRLLGRLTGLVVLLPLAFFASTGRVGPRRAGQLAAVFGLGGLQGALGWYMVKSGLVDEPRVSPYRLTAHLLLALLLFGALLRIALGTLSPRGEGPAAWPALRRGALALLMALVLALTWGGLMAGFHAGLAAPTFPTINGAWFPDGIWTSSPAWMSLVESPFAVHVTHRLLAYTVLGGALALGVAVRRAREMTKTARRLALAVVALALAQVTLGALVVTRYVPIGWASLHQVNAVALLAALLALIHYLAPGRPLPPSPGGPAA
jgi:cytochrome c oxidase assembly protein subunit 15